MDRVGLPRALSIVLAIAGVALIAALAFILGRYSAANRGMAGETEVSAAPAAAHVVDRFVPAEAREGSYAWATSREVLNMNPAFLETRLGPAREKSAGSMMFDLGGCLVTYTVERTAVRSFWAPVTERCRPSLAETIGEELRVSTATTFGEIERARQGGVYAADCLELCGNVADPTVELRIGGYHADNYVQVAFSSVAAGEDGSLEGLSAWTEAVRKQLHLDPDQRLPDGRSICARDPPPEAVAILRRAHISLVRVTTGFGDYLNRCR